MDWRILFIQLCKIDKHCWLYVYTYRQDANLLRSCHIKSLIYFLLLTILVIIYVFSIFLSNKFRISLSDVYVAKIPNKYIQVSGRQIAYLKQIFSIYWTSVGRLSGASSSSCALTQLMPLEDASSTNSLAEAHQLST